MIFLNDKKVDVRSFPDGTPNFVFEEVPFAEGRFYNPYFDITWKFDNMAELFQLQCLVDWLDLHNQYVRDLYLPYIPNARMDRVKTDADVFTLKTFANIINDMKFDHVYVRNAHSNVSLALIDNIVDNGCELNISQTILDILQWTDAQPKNITLFFPDEGATKRYADYETVKKYPIATGLKKRNWADGKILGLEVLTELRTTGNGNCLAPDIKDKDILIVDDICSKGGTFYYSAIELKKMGANRIFLYVTHCEDVIDWKKLKDAGIVKVYTTSSIFRNSAATNADDDPVRNGFIEILDSEEDA